MPHPSAPDDTSRSLVCFAAERTLTSWIRTALSLMALGFVIDRFDLVLRQIVTAPGRHALSQRALWQWAGSIMIAAAALMALSAGLWYLRYALRWRREAFAADARGLAHGASDCLPHAQARPCQGGACHQDRERNHLPDHQP